MSEMKPEEEKLLSDQSLMNSGVVEDGLRPVDPRQKVRAIRKRIKSDRWLTTILILLLVVSILTNPFIEGHLIRQNSHLRADVDTLVCLAFSNAQTQAEQAATISREAVFEDLVRQLLVAQTPQQKAQIVQQLGKIQLVEPAGGSTSTTTPQGTGQSTTVPGSTPPTTTRSHPPTTQPPVSVVPPVPVGPPLTTPPISVPSITIPSVRLTADFQKVTKGTVIDCPKAGGGTVKVQVVPSS